MYFVVVVVANLLKMGTGKSKIFPHLNTASLYLLPTSEYERSAKIVFLVSRSTPSRASPAPFNFKTVVISQGQLMRLLVIPQYRYD